MPGLRRCQRDEPLKASIRLIAYHRMKSRVAADDLFPGKTGRGSLPRLRRVRRAVHAAYVVPARTASRGVKYVVKGYH
jgi:hypothetical protein